MENQTHTKTILPKWGIFITIAILAVGGIFLLNRDREKPGTVSLRLQWFDLAQFAGFYSAQDEGYYQDMCIDVEIRPGGPDLNAINLVASKSDTFGVWTADHVLIAQSKGVPIVILSAIYRDDPNVLMVKPDSGIRGPKDFVGKTVTTVFGRSTESVLTALLAKEGVDKSKVKIEPFPFNIQSFLQGKVDVSAAYVYDHPFQARAAGQEVRLIKPSDYGIKFYSDCIIARRELVEKNPDLVRDFIAASVKGWEFALANQDKAVASTLKRSSSLDEPSQTYMLKHAEPLIRAENPERIGLVDPASLEKMAAILKEQGQLPADFDPKSSFDNTFVEAFYKK